MARIDGRADHAKSEPGGKARIPFGGAKATGISEREQGSATPDFDTELKIVVIDYTGRKRARNLYRFKGADR